MPTDTKSRRFQALLACTLAAAFSGGCSFLFHADARQCSASSDCGARGFAGYTCEVATGTCVAPVSSLPEAGAEGGVDAGACQSYSDCPVPTNTNHVEVACDVDTSRCVQLTTDECPYVIGDYKGAAGPAPVFIGAFATIPTNGPPQAHPSYLNYQLALNEFAGQGGIQLGTALRMPVAVVCDDTADPALVMSHLVNDVHVPALVAAIPSTTLRTTFSNVNGSTGATPKVFFINPFGADSTLTSLTTNGLLWHMLGQPSDVAPAYAAFFPDVEAYARKTQNLVMADGGAVPMRVATVTASSTDTLDLAAAVKPLLQWNGGPAVAQNPNYTDVVISQSTLDGFTVDQIDVSGAVASLLQFQPNVVVSFGSEEFVKLVETLEFEWTSGPRPFYILGPYNSESTGLLSWIAGDESRRIRLGGINFASVANNPVLSDYDTRFIAAYPEGQDLVDEENYYDAMYFTVYALVAGGGAPNLTGTNLANGMPRLVAPAPPGVPFDMGPADIGNVTQQLVLSSKPVSLIGTLGPPAFNSTTGARESEGDVYCVGRYPPGGDAGSALPYYATDVLRLQDADGGAPADGGPAALQGTFSCFDGMAP
jgi:hypothetical protein